MATSSPLGAVSLQLSRRRRNLFRLTAILLGLMPFAMAEGVLRWLNWGDPRVTSDPYVGFEASVPLFVPDDSGKWMQIAANREPFFRPDRFLRTKPTEEFRIFCLGGSTVQGRPYAIETSFTSWLELSLQAADPSRAWQVVNCGGVSYASYRLAPILEEVLTHEPDLIVLYTGHNEFLEDRTYHEMRDMSPASRQGRQALRHSRLIVVASQWWRKRIGGELPEVPSERAVLQTEVDALLDHQGGLAAYHRDAQWRADVVVHFELNLERMCLMARQAKIPLLLVNPVVNLRDTPPFKSEHGDGLTDEERNQFEQLWDQAKQIPWESLPLKTDLTRRALAIDEQFADTHFLMGRCHEAAAQPELAKQSYLRAKDEDICPLRILEPMRASIAAVTTRHGVPLLDVQSLFAAEADGGIPGDQQLVDHVHPRIEGHQRIAAALREWMVEQRYVKPQQGWEERQVALFTERYRTLPPTYFPHAEIRLRGLQRWSQGRAGEFGPE